MVPVSNFAPTSRYCQLMLISSSVKPKSRHIGIHRQVLKAATRSTNNFDGMCSRTQRIRPRCKIACGDGTRTYTIWSGELLDAPASDHHTVNFQIQLDRSTSIALIPLNTRLCGDQHNAIVPAGNVNYSLTKYRLGAGGGASCGADASSNAHICIAPIGSIVALLKFEWVMPRAG